MFVIFDLFYPFTKLVMVTLDTLICFCCYIYIALHLQRVKINAFCADSSLVNVVMFILKFVCHCLIQGFRLATSHIEMFLLLERYSVTFLTLYTCLAYSIGNVENECVSR